MAEIKELRPNLKADENGLHGRQKEIQDEILLCLEEYLAMAKQGKFQAIAVVAVDKDFGTRSGISPSDCPSTLLGGLEFAKQKLMVVTE